MYTRPLNSTKRITTFLLLLLAPIFLTPNSAFPQQKTYPGSITYSIQSLKDHEELGKFIYFFEEKGDLLHVTINLSSEVQNRKEAELWFSTQNGLPIRSLKWVYTPQGILELESNYYGDYLEIHLSAPQGQKRSRISLKKPVFDFEQLFFVVTKWQNRSTASLPVFVPISGMVWKARLKKIQDSSSKKLFLVQIAGEKLYLTYEHEELYPSKVKAPQRGYQLVLKRVLSE